MQMEQIESCCFHLPCPQVGLCSQNWLYLNGRLSCNRELLVGNGYCDGTPRSRVSGNWAGNLLFRLACHQEIVRQPQKIGTEHPGLVAVAVGESAGPNVRVSASASLPLPVSWQQGLTDASSSLCFRYLFVNKARSFERSCLT